EVRTDGPVHGCAQQPPRRRHRGRRRGSTRRGPAGPGAPRRPLSQLLGGRGGWQGVLPGRGAERRRCARGAPGGARLGRRRDLPRLAGVMEAQEVGTAFLEALTTREFAAARALLSADVRFTMLVPSGLMTEADAEGTIGRFIDWFGSADAFEVEAAGSEEVEGRAAITYRFRLHDPDGWQVIQQHIMLDVGGDG